MAPVLIIDDDERERSLLKKHLCARGHCVVEASNGRQGIDRFCEVQPSLVIVDLLMPVMDGLEIIAALCSSSFPVPIIAMAEDGKGMPAGLLLKIAEKMGAQQVLAKPFGGDELDLAIDRVLGTLAAPSFVVLDDDADARHLNRCALKKAFPRSTVVECESPAEALAASLASAPDAIITDHHLGQDDGIHFLERLREKGVGCPVLMVTRSCDPAVHQRAYQAGADGVFWGLRPDFTGFLQKRLSADYQAPAPH